VSGVGAPELVEEGVRHFVAGRVSEARAAFERALVDDDDFHRSLHLRFLQKESLDRSRTARLVAVNSGDDCNFRRTVTQLLDSHLTKAGVEA